MESRAGSDLELAAAIAMIRGELTKARDEGADQEFRFRLGPVEIELSLEVSATQSAEGGVKVFVVSLDASGTRTQVASHRLKLQLFPTDEEGRDIDVAGMTPAKPIG